MKLLIYFGILLPIFLSSVSPILADDPCLGACKPSCQGNEENAGQLNCSPPNTCCTFKQKPFCVGNDPNVTTDSPFSGKIATAIGCIPVFDAPRTAAFLLVWGIGIGGGIAFILIVYSGYMVTTSSGDPRRLQAGKELLTAATSGLLLLIFSAYILRVVGVDILEMPGF